MKRRFGALVVLTLVMPFLIASTAIAKGPPEIVIIPQKRGKKVEKVK